MHPETLIVQEVAAILVAANTVAEGRVFPYRKVHFLQDEMPGIAVYILEDDSEVRNEAPRSHKRDALLVIELRLESGATIDDVSTPMNELRLEVENKTYYNRHLVSCAENFTPTGTVTDLDASGERVVAVAAMSYSVVYNSNTPMPESAVPFEKAKATYNQDGDVDPGNQVEDCLVLEGDQS